MTSSESYQDSFEAVQAEEQQWLRIRRQAAGQTAARNKTDDTPLDDTVGLAFSGGGIRSATFNLGVLQSLEKSGLLNRIDYLSSVSGGGYIASCLSWLRAHLPVGNKNKLFDTPLHNARGSVLDWIRAHDKYLINERDFSRWTLVASMLAAVSLNLIVFLPLLFLLVSLASVDLPTLQWPYWLHLPGADPVFGHDGFGILLAAGGISLALYALAVLVFALISGIAALRSLLAILWVRQAMGILLAWGVGLIEIGLLPVLVGAEESALYYLQSDAWATATKHATYLLPAIVGGGIMLFTNYRRKRRGETSNFLATAGLVMVLYGLLVMSYQITDTTGLVHTISFHAVLALSIFLAIVCDINWISMHSYYRSRLAGAYLPPVLPEIGSAIHFKMHNILPNSGGPYQIINTTINTSSSKNQKSLNRGGENFIFSPLWCGAASTGYRRTKDYLDGHTTLSTACTISGAAVDPNTYATRSRPVAFLMALFNFRLGFWAPNPRYENHGSKLPWWYVLIGREMLGRGLSEDTRHVHLSDGGHFENLGLYELLRRHCKYIIVSDAGADPLNSLRDLGQVVERARTDFGVEVDIKADRLYQESQKMLTHCPFIVGKARYRDGSTAEILYLKPMMRTELTVDIYAYWRENPEFPNESTANQFFNEAQFNAYRELGQQLFDGIVGNVKVDSIDQLFERARAADCVSQSDDDATGLSCSTSRPLGD